MLKRAAAYCLVVMALCTAHTAAAFTNGRELLQYCSVAAKAVRTGNAGSFDYGAMVKGGQCIGFLQGITNTNGLYEALLARMANRPRAIFCAPPQGITNGQAVLIVESFLVRNPRELEETAIVVALHAFKEVFPCPHESKGGR